MVLSDGGNCYCFFVDFNINKLILLLIWDRLGFVICLIGFLFFIIYIIYILNGFFILFFWV